MYINPTTQKIFVRLKICVYTFLSSFLAPGPIQTAQIGFQGRPPDGKTLRPISDCHVALFVPAVTN